MINPNVDRIITQTKLASPVLLANNIAQAIILIRGRIEDRDYLLKIISKSKTAKVANYQREKKASKLLAKLLPEYNMTLIRESGYTGEYFWMIRDYYEGESLSTYSSTKYGLLGYDVIQKKFFSAMPSVLTTANEFLIDLRRAEHEVDLGETRFERKLENCDINNIEAGIGVSLQKQLDYYNEKHDEFWEERLCAYSINDMVPSNIIISKDEKVIFSDFEWMSYDHTYTDVVFIWLYLWRYPVWQKSWYDMAFKEQGLKDDLFQAAIIRHVINWYNNLYNPNRDLNDKVIENQKIYKQHIFTKYLLAAGNSLDELININQIN